MTMIDSSQYDPDDICPICHDNYGTTKGIYKTECNHIFHNDCLNEYCELKHGEISCPICRGDVGDACMAVWAFKEKALGNPMSGPLFNGNQHILDIYRNQNSTQGGRRHKRVKKTKKTKRRSSKNRRTITKRKGRR
jgi:hypothetical protein